MRGRRRGHGDRRHPRGGRRRRDRPPRADRPGARRHRDPRDPDRFVADLAEVLTEVTSDPARAGEMGRAGRRRAEDHFSWDAIAERTMEVYERALTG